MPEREKFRIVIDFCVRLGDDLPEIIKKLEKAYGSESPHRSTISRWFYYFKKGGNKISDKNRSGRPQDPVNPRLLDQISSEINRNPKISLSLLASVIGETKGYVSNLIYSRLEYRRTLAKWVPKVLTEAQKKIRVQNARMVLSEYKNKWKYLIDNLVTVDETWIYYEPKLTPRTAGEWKLPGQKPPQLGRIKNNPKKVMATVFWNSKGVLLIDYLQTGHSITADYYCQLLEKLQKKIPQYKRKKVILLHDNCPAHTAKITKDKLHELQWKILKHPPYSPDMSPSDYYLFRNLKNDLLTTRFMDAEHVKRKVSTYFDSKPKEWFFHGIEMLKNQLENVIKNKGEYVS